LTVKSRDLGNMLGFLPHSCIQINGENGGSRVENGRQGGHQGGHHHGQHETADARREQLVDQLDEGLENRIKVNLFIFV